MTGVTNDFAKRTTCDVGHENHRCYEVCVETRRVFLIRDMSDLDTFAYILLKSLYVCGIVCGLTPPLLLIAVLLDEWRRAKKAHPVIMSEQHALRVPVGASEPQVLGNRQ